MFEYFNSGKINDECKSQYTGEKLKQSLLEIEI